MAYCTERLLDAPLAFEQSLGTEEQRILAMEEDRAWFADAVCLADSDGLPPEVVDRTRSFFNRLEDVCSDQQT